MRDRRNVKKRAASAREKDRGASSTKCEHGDGIHLEDARREKTTAKTRLEGRVRGGSGVKEKKSVGTARKP